jgi:hypothetical protein
MPAHETPSYQSRADARDVEALDAVVTWARKDNG